MQTKNVWQSSVDLTNRITQVTSGLKLPRGAYWPTLVTVSLHQANERLNSIWLLLKEGDVNSATILTRSLFELAVNLSYIARDSARRLRQYLKHGRMPLTREEAQQMQQEIDRGAQPAVKDIVPGQAWKRLKDMCCDLGSDWLKEYETFYRYASVPTHAGAFTLGEKFIRLLTGQLPTDRERAAVLVTASEFHLRVAQIAAKTFPGHIAMKEVEKLREECSDLGWSLLNH